MKHTTHQRAWALLITSLISRHPSLISVQKISVIFQAEVSRGRLVEVVRDGYLAFGGDTLMNEVGSVVWRRLSLALSA